MKSPVYISSIATVSPLGWGAQIWENYRKPLHFFEKHNFEGNEAFAAFLPKELREKISLLRKENPRLKDVDLSVLYAVYAARAAVKSAGWEKEDNIGINIGSSRGATTLFEDYHRSFINSGKSAVLASPTTTLGNISSWVSQDLRSRGPEFSHSVTCSTGLHAILNAVAWLQAGMASKFLAGASEAALTPFTIAQMQAMKLYATQDLDFPCRALDMNKSKNSMILGEAAGVLCLQNTSDNAIAKIEGVGFSTEDLKHSVSISANAQCLQKSMKMAIGDLEPDEIDAVVMHAPGTIKGDRAEVNAIKEVFGSNLPAMTCNKWKTGHSFGASGILSMDMALLMLLQQEFIPVPFEAQPPRLNRLEKILINAVGFGGNAVSILISKN